jgi:predicted NUDIX family NTP pyrophosphohydrolase
MKISAGLLMYRIKDGNPELLLVHPGGPFYAHKDNGTWSMPKGTVENDEDLLETAKREFTEETGFAVPSNVKFIPLPELKRSDKIVHVWAFLGDCDPNKVVSNTCMVEWPPKSGKQIEIPEIDRAGFFGIEEAKVKLYPYMVSVVDSLKSALAS